MPSYPFTQNSAPAADESSPSRVGPYHIDTVVSIVPVRGLHPDLTLRGSTTPTSATTTPCNSRPNSPRNAPVAMPPTDQLSLDQENHMPNTGTPTRDTRHAQLDSAARRRLFMPDNTDTSGDCKGPSEKN